VCARARARVCVCERERELKRNKFWKINTYYCNISFSNMHKPDINKKLKKKIIQ